MNVNTVAQENECITVFAFGAFDPATKALAAIKAEIHFDLRFMRNRTLEIRETHQRTINAGRGNFQPVDLRNGIFEIENRRQRNADLLAIIDIHRAVGPLGHDLQGAAGLGPPHQAQAHDLVARSLRHRVEKVEELPVFRRPGVVDCKRHIGKIGVPDHIMLKPGPLSPDEWVVMKRHPQIGADIIGEHPSSLLRLARHIALGHHEKWNGTGYPQGLVGEAIPIEARIVAIADVFDALTTARPYKKAWTVEAAIDALKEGAGQHFDPVLVPLFIASMPEVLEIRERWKEDASAQ